MPLTPDDLFARLDRLQIKTTTHRHPPVFTVAEAAALRGALPGGHCKNLFLRDRREGFWLVVTLEDRGLDLKKLADRLGAPKFSFASPERLMAMLGVIPGSVTPFAVANDPDRRVTVILDEEMMGFDPLNYHPLVNDATTAIAPADLLRFLADCGHAPRVVNLSGLERDGAPGEPGAREPGAGEPS